MGSIKKCHIGNGLGKSVALAPRGSPNRLRQAILGLLLVGLVAVPDHARAEDIVARGAYLARITGCEGCHSTHDAAGAVAPSRLMAGGDHPIRAGNGVFIVPPNITPDRDTGIGGWTAAAIVAAIRTGRTPDGRTLSIAMPWRTQYADLTDEDAQAIAAYLLTVPPVHIDGAVERTTR
ncbi:MAG: hypothetical protein QOH05_3338 [Acetobacteraceae bacterium]|jgi:hypothetical protein|nr:hypothetical protein [Acetobacteraceae bacterium]